MMEGVDWTSAHVTLSAADPLKSGDNLRIEHDITWSPATGKTISHLVFYAEHRVRDWRWLWLRRKMVVRYLGSEGFDL